MPNIIGKGQKEEGPKECEQEIVERVEKGLGEELGELKAKRSDINDEDTLESGWTNVQRTSQTPQNPQNRLKVGRRDKESWQEMDREYGEQLLHDWMRTQLILSAFLSNLEDFFLILFVAFWAL